MSFTLNVKADIKQAQRYLSKVEKVAVRKAAARALNRTAQQVRTQAIRDIAKETAIKQKNVRQAVRLSVKAKANSLHSIVEARGKTINLIEFVTPARKKVGAFRKQKGVRARAWGKSKVYRGTFIGSGKNSGKLLVFSRTGKGRKSPIEAKYGPSVPRTFVQNKIMQQIKTTAGKRWPINFAADLKFYLGKVK